LIKQVPDRWVDWATLGQPINQYQCKAGMNKVYPSCPLPGGKPALLDDLEGKRRKAPKTIGIFRISPSNS
jgi:hypothetical protein